MGTRSWQRVWLRWFSLCGIVAPPVTVLVNALAAAAQPDYDGLRQYVSDLATPGRPYADALCALWAAFPLLFGPFAVAVYAGLRGHRFGWAAPLLLGLFGLCLGLCGVFRHEPDSAGHLASSWAHVVASAVACLALFPCPSLVWLATRHDPDWRRFGRLSLWFQAAGTGAFLLLVLAFAEVFPWQGVAERCLWGVYYVWVVALALRIRRLDAAAATGADRVPYRTETEPCASR